MKFQIYTYMFSPINLLDLEGDKEVDSAESL